MQVCKPFYTCDAEALALIPYYTRASCTFCTICDPPGDYLANSGQCALKPLTEVECNNALQSQARTQGGACALFGNASLNMYQIH